MTETVSRKAEAAPPTGTATLWNLSVICLLAWIIPGSGHILLRCSRRALAFFIAVLVLFFGGLALGSKLYQYEAQQPLSLFAMFAQVGAGLPYFIARFIASYAKVHTGSAFYSFAEGFQFGNGYIERVTFEYGNTFTIVAGLLNFLIILDAYDIAVGRKKG